MSTSKSASGVAGGLPYRKKFRIATNVSGSWSKKTAPSSSLARTCRPLNMACRTEPGTAVSVVKLVMTRVPPTLSRTAVLALSSWSRQTRSSALSLASLASSSFSFASSAFARASRLASLSSCSAIFLCLYFSKFLRASLVSLSSPFPTSAAYIELYVLGNRIANRVSVRMVVMTTRSTTPPSFEEFEEDVEKMWLCSAGGRIHDVSIETLDDSLFDMDDDD
mmetsp:Transcript_2473/g.6162  ORF Transcript_2473/g.6162 Transcript_2473/m.6162 type:complete len:222 (+) Transcript_2473:278-943(+)